LRQIPPLQAAWPGVGIPASTAADRDFSFFSFGEFFHLTKPTAGAIFNWVEGWSVRHGLKVIVSAKA
jgi:hypothetical protein